ncbi:succinate dehydrogenase cytochrome b subunit [Georgenia yuyongxinii]|uniref:Succinate dehydrogenase cytochrome b subunit n=1 Tax=Georgenia yuyongxinii TaxID=2589797 RepID=A0A5B8C6Q2_9MICO|nr:succinate dehydrogenase cytochrome b subunit [Georgenia yuyongxinii]QDC25837.1 succinate dehydrogenase cytochrome b subunit [Georgenia yuyongxinii]
MVTTTAPTRPRRARNTTVALKVTMAVTGVLFVLFVLLHMYGNLKAFSGQEAFDGYAAGLRTLLYPYLPHEGFLWIQRAVLVIALVVHVAAAATLWRRARGARHTRYVMHKRQVQTYASRTMRWGGLIILAFVIFHLLQFTTLTINVGGTFDSPYQRLVEAFQPEHWYVYLAYLVAILALTMHVRHGVWSGLQTLGASNRRRQRAINLAAYAVAAVLLVGFMAPPTAILLGFVN